MTREELNLKVNQYQAFKQNQEDILRQKAMEEFYEEMEIQSKVVEMVNTQVNNKRVDEISIDEETILSEDRHAPDPSKNSHYSSKQKAGSSRNAADQT